MKEREKRAGIARSRRDSFTASEYWAPFTEENRDEANVAVQVVKRDKS